MPPQWTIRCPVSAHHVSTVSASAASIPASESLSIGRWTDGVVGVAAVPGPDAAQHVLHVGGAQERLARPHECPQVPLPRAHVPVERGARFLAPLDENGAKPGALHEPAKEHPGGEHGFPRRTNRRRDPDDLGPRQHLRHSHRRLTRERERADVRRQPRPQPRPGHTRTPVYLGPTALLQGTLRVPAHSRSRRNRIGASPARPPPSPGTDRDDNRSATSHDHRGGPADRHGGPDLTGAFPRQDPPLLACCSTADPRLSRHAGSPPTATLTPFAVLPARTTPARVASSQAQHSQPGSFLPRLMALAVTKPLLPRRRRSRRSGRRRAGWRAGSRPPHPVARCGRHESRSGRWRRSRGRRR